MSGAAARPGCYLARMWSASFHATGGAGGFPIDLCEDEEDLDIE
jgi:hypothetical protein